MRLLEGYSQKNLILISIVIIVAASLAAVAFQFSNQTVDRINEVSISGIRTNAEIQALDLSNSVANKLTDTTGTLQIISNAPAITESNLTKAKIIINQAQNSSGGLVDFYLWLDHEGKIVWISNINESTYAQYKGFDLSYRLYFLTPKQTHQAYYSSVTDSNDRINRLYISYPILHSTQNSSIGGQFQGIIAAGIRTDVLGRFLESQLAPKLQSEVVVLDNTGIILYSNHPEYEGKNVFGIRFQTLLSSMSVDTLEQMNSGFTSALHGKAGSSEIVLDSNGHKGTFAYRPILLYHGQFGVLYVVAPYTIASDVASLTNQQSSLFLGIIVLIGASAAGIVFSIVAWNRRLDQIVKSRTIELEEANRSLQDANEQLKVHEKLQTEFVNIAAHELRTPIQPLLGTAEIMDGRLDNAGIIQVTKPEIEMILRNARRLEHLSSDILQVSRIDSGALKLNLQEFNLSSLIEEVIRDASVRSNFDEKKMNLSFFPKDIIVYADKEKITEVLSNLISNAIKFTKNGLISITTVKDPDKNIARVSVTDGGEGIDPEVMPKLFEKFVTKSNKGTGLGLYICKKIIEAHGGMIIAENNSESQGATFTFTVPLANGAG